MAEKKIAIGEHETQEQAGECCEPECGPTTCEPAVEAPKKASSGCGPSTCS